jgi:oligo-1,6-glucosidase
MSTPTPSHANTPWWQRAVIYQIYPRSFCDSNGDGIGDLAGITSKLDHLKTLGVDMVWLSPIYASPDDDNGYDISDYRAIHADFGTMVDFDAMLDGMHQRGIRLMMDLVVNHTSDDHAWFQQARTSRDNPFHDYYIWAEPVQGGPPTNWESIFGGSTWEWNEATGEYYLHLFTRRQPDLNWDNPKVREEVQALTRFWMDRGVDGFRIDAINFISKPARDAKGRFPNAPVRQPGFLQPAFETVVNGRHMVDHLRELKHKAFLYKPCVTVAEMAGVGPAMAAELTDRKTGVVDMLFQFEHMGMDQQPGGSKWALAPIDWPAFKRCLSSWQTELADRGWNSLYLNNHDQPRSVSRLADGSPAAAKMLALMTHGMQGTPYVYQGEEIAMTNFPFQRVEECRDVEILNLYRLWVQEQGRTPEETLTAIRAKGRDNARTPMQWSAAPQAGFTTGTPWIAVNPNHVVIHAEAQHADPDSVFNFYRRLIALRKQLPVLTHGRYAWMLQDHAQVFAYTRTLGMDRLLVVCNHTGQPADVDWPPALDPSGAQLLLCNLPQRAAAPLRTLRPWEAMLLRWPSKKAPHDAGP